MSFLYTSDYLLLIVLTSIGCCPVSAAELERFRGLNSKTAKSMVSNLQHEVSVSRLKLLELERANAELECLLRTSGNIPEFSYDPQSR